MTEIARIRCDNSPRRRLPSSGQPGSSRWSRTPARPPLEMSLPDMQRRGRHPLGEGAKGDRHLPRLCPRRLRCARRCLALGVWQAVRPEPTRVKSPLDPPGGQMGRAPRGAGPARDFVSARPAGAHGRAANPVTDCRRLARGGLGAPCGRAVWSVAARARAVSIMAARTDQHATNLRYSQGAGCTVRSQPQEAYLVCRPVACGPACRTTGGLRPGRRTTGAPGRRRWCRVPRR